MCKKKLLEAVREQISHQKKHLIYMRITEIKALLTHRAVERHVCFFWGGVDGWGHWWFVGCAFPSGVGSAFKCAPSLERLYSEQGRGLILGIGGRRLA